MRVLMITPPLPTLERRGRTAAEGRLAPLARQIASVRALGVTALVLEVRGPPKLKYLQVLPRVQKLARNADLIHAHYGFCGWLARAQREKPVVVSFMGDDVLGTPDERGRTSLLSRGVVQADRWLAREVDAVIVKSEEMARAVAPARAFVLPNGVDLQAFYPLPQARARALLGLAVGKRYVLFPGCPDEPRKGFALARAATERARGRISEPLELLPLWGVPPEQVPLYMNACDAMLMTSFLEGSPNVVKEALACNLPVVSVPVGDVPELLAGVLRSALTERDAGALAAALVETLAAGGRSDGRAALVARGLDLESVARRLLDIYRGALAGRGQLCAA